MEEANIINKWQSSCKFQFYNHQTSAPSMLEHNQYTKWYPSSRATNHIIANSTNLMTKISLVQTRFILVMVRVLKWIKHIEHSSFPSPYSSKTLTLRNLLHVPHIKKNLLSVSQFCFDNNVLFEFHLKVCFVKDHAFKTMVLRGTYKMVFTSLMKDKFQFQINYKVEKQDILLAVYQVYNWSLFSSLSHVRKICLKFLC